MQLMGPIRVTSKQQYSMSALIGWRVCIAWILVYLGGWARPLRLKVPLKVPLKGTLRSIEGLVSPPPPPLRRSEALRVPLRYPLRYPLRSPLRYPLRSPLRYPLRYPLRSPLKVPLKGTLKVPLQGTLQGYP